MTTTQCAAPKATRRVANPGTGPIAYCPGCKAWRPAAQVAWSDMRRNSAGDITATYAPIGH